MNPPGTMLRDAFPDFAVLTLTGKPVSWKTTWKASLLLQTHWQNKSTFLSGKQPTPKIHFICWRHWFVAANVYECLVLTMFRTVLAQDQTEPMLFERPRAQEATGNRMICRCPLFPTATSTNSRDCVKTQQLSQDNTRSICLTHRMQMARTKQSPQVVLSFKGLVAGASWKSNWSEQVVWWRPWQGHRHLLSSSPAPL